MALAVAGPAVALAQRDTAETRRIAIARRLTESTVTVQVRGGGTGSGFVVGDERWIVTNAHVVRGFSRRPLVVHFPSTAEPVPARVLVFDDRVDLAILACDGDVPSPPLALGDSDRVQVGQDVLAFGSPHGLSGTLTRGIVSALRNGLPGVEDAPVGRVIQTDATINPGNSGGPLVDSRGHVIGVNTLIWSRTGGSEGIGFALPSNLVRDLLRHVRSELASRSSEEEARSRSSGSGAQHLGTLPLTTTLGITGADFRGFGLVGFRIQSVDPDGPGAAAGLRGATDPSPGVVRRLGLPWTGYVILAVDGAPIRGGRDLARHLARYRPGDQVVLTIAVPPGVLTGDTSVVLRGSPGP